ncbi:hypothetical protein BP5796_05183 [Coleophoma crateriformis]|uniref:Uncharacterized protein n=1 Tax=Coleophoma crateriformis TaxID=565419 RepID=A0A3D8S2I2_9HELO|nr:hypothetical protein BP5796_05183 [Coleophoma crateriformis]
MGLHVTHPRHIPSQSKRGLGNVTNITSSIAGTSQTVSDHEAYVLQCLALSFSVVSVASATLAFYWFVKMRRSFRHDLIMLLIQSDMFKALWFMVYPIVTFIHGPVRTNSTFCQVHGFFIALGIEASDFAILMIALHTALYIFKSRTAAAEGGLYPYRYTAYLLWVIVPTIMAALGFLNGDNAYKSNGTYCYLPARPFWYRLALSWIPRYVIFVVIVAIYVSIYYYVRYKFNHFAKEESDSSGGSNGSGASNPFKRSSLPTTPTLASHGLIPALRPASYDDAALDARRKRKQSVASPDIEAHRFIWASVVSRENNPVAPLTPPPSPPIESSLVDFESPAAGPSSPSIQTPPQAHTPYITFSLRTPPPETPSLSGQTSWTNTFSSPFSNSDDDSSHKRSIADIFFNRRQKPSSTPATTPPATRLQLLNSQGQDFAVSEMMRTREKIRRQLRFLFIYPLVYMVMWALPFASHIMQYRDSFANDPPFILSCLTTVCICSQAAVDCWLFSTREKPWRHVPGNESNHTFLRSLRFWSGWTEVKARRKSKQHGPGKTRQEMAREAMQAYRRRDEEMAERRRDSGNFEAARVKPERSWWDDRPADETPDLRLMSPVTEERSHPMEDALLTAPTTSSEKVKTIETHGEGNENPTKEDKKA